VHPVVLGVGKKVFDGGAVPTNVTLLEPPLRNSNGYLLARVIAPSVMFAGRFTDDRGWLRSGRCPDTPADKFVAAAGDTD
jgi:hypothetical protein